MKIRHEIRLQPNDVGGDIDDAFAFDPADYNGSLTQYFEFLNLTQDVIGLTIMDSSSNIHHQNADGYTLGDLIREAMDVDLTDDTYILNGTKLTFSLARVVIIQDTGTDPITAIEHQISIADCETELYHETTLVPMTYPKIWKYTAASWDGTKAFYVEAVFKALNDKYGVYVYLQEDDGSFGNWGSSQEIAIAENDTTATMHRTRVGFTPTDGRHYRIAYKTVGTKGSYGISIINARIIVQQTSATAVTKFEKEHELISVGGASTGLQSANTKWDPDEYDGLTISAVYNQLECASASDDADLYEDADDTPSKIASSDATGTANLVRSSDIKANMPSSADELDSYVNTVDSAIHATRVIVLIDLPAMIIKAQNLIITSIGKFMNVARASIEKIQNLALP